MLMYKCVIVVFTYSIIIYIRYTFGKTPTGTNTQYVYSCITLCTFPSHAQYICTSHKNKNKKYSLLTHTNTLASTYYGIVHAYF